MSYTTGTLSFEFLTLDGELHTGGTVRIVPSVKVLKDTTGHAVLAGGVSVEIGKDEVGAVTVELPATDDATLDPAGVTYTVIPPKGWGSKVSGVSVFAGQTRHFADLMSVDPTAPTYAQDFTRAEYDAVADQIADVTAVIDDLPATLAEFVPRWQAATVYAAGDAVLNPAGDIVTAVTGFTSGASYDADDWNLSTSYVRQQTIINNLPTVYYGAHRGGGGVGPEGTMPAYRIAAAGGADLLDGDVQPLGDDTLVLWHDDDVARTTDSTGLVADYTAPTFQSLNAAAHFPGFGVVPPAFVQEWFGEFGGQKPLQLEPKDGDNATQLMDLADAAGMQGSLIVATTSLGTLAIIKARGYFSYFGWLSTPSDAAIDAAVAAGADSIGGYGMNAAVNLPDAKIAYMVATGLPVQLFTIQRRNRRDQLVAMGVRGILGNQPVYLKRSTAFRTSDSWRQGSFGHGLIPGGLGTESAVGSISGGVLSLPDDSTQLAGFNFVLVGELCPIANRASSYTLSVETALDAVSGSTTIGPTLAFGMLDDKPFVHSTTQYQQGYTLYFNDAGSFRLYRLDTATTAAQLGVNTATAPMAAGVFVKFQVDVTPTTITAVRKDTPVATLSAGLTSGVAVTSIPINALPVALLTASKVQLSTGQVATLSAAASAGATSLTVSSITPSSAVASGSSLYAAIQATDSTYRGGYVHIGKRAATGRTSLWKNFDVT